ncbi:tetratricopeptide repeat protein [Jiella mangrovi]|uniref:Tetratricopeptide repeat protein n=1 Tax=Jiella mangrovi TaxID=2821407 RepID=A0ABS4BEG0_9HYPH|nr:tetratricopeptide repeat protein [Jiella mangrovi]MBP0615133.1 tetratricopeptide repeat protein [Jiella mangrovi]
MALRAHRPTRHFKRGGICAATLALLAIQGCASVSSETTGSIGRSNPAQTGQPASGVPAAQLDGAVRSYGQAYQKNPKDKGTGLSYAALLQMVGRNDQSLAVMQQVAIAHPDDRDVLSAYGKALAAAGNLPKALETIRRAQTPDRPDWRLFSAEGAILDQMGKSDEARTFYRKALEIQPNEPTVLSNLGMSYVLTNDLASAERYLKQAVQQRGVDSRVRQNLALVVGLQGRFAEAKQIASAELDPQQAEANVAFLQSMLDQQNTWSQLKEKDKRS